MKVVAFVLVFLCPSLSFCSSAHAWVQLGNWVVPAKELTVVISRFCLDWPTGWQLSTGDPCLRYTDDEWRSAISSAGHEWNDVGSSFTFHFRMARGEDHPCQRSGEVFVILALPHQACPGDSPMGSAAGKAVFTGSASPSPRIYINAHYLNAYYTIGTSWMSLRRVILHELGHVLGLGHPPAHVQAVMVPGSEWLRLQPDDIAGILALYPPEPAHTIVVIENPLFESAQSGISVISGWVCDAESLRLFITPAGNWYEHLVVTGIPYGGDRADTESHCGDRDNGFGLLFNWNTLGDGEYYVMVETDDGRFSWAAVTVTTLGEEFRRGLEGTWEVDGFPDPNSSVTIEWSEALQNFVIVEHNP